MSSTASLPDLSRHRGQPPTEGNCEEEHWTDVVCQGLGMCLMGLGMLWVYATVLAILLMAPLLLSAGFLFFGWVPVLAMGVVAAVGLCCACGCWLLGRLTPLPPVSTVINWIWGVVILVGAPLFLAGYLVASAIACYAPSLIAKLHSLTVADCLQFWRNLPPGAIPDVLHSLLNYMLDDLCGAPSGAAADHTSNGSTGQQAVKQMPTESQTQFQGMNPSAILPRFGSEHSNTPKASPTVPVASSSSTSDRDFAQGANMGTDLPPAEPPWLSSSPLGFNADHLPAAARPFRDGCEDEEHVEAAFPNVVAMQPLLTDAIPTPVRDAAPVPDAAPASDLAQAGNELSMGAASPVYQNTAPSAAIMSQNSFTSGTNTHKIPTGDCSIAAIDINANSSSSADIVSSPSTAVLVRSPSGADCQAVPAKPVAGGTISAHYNQQPQQQRPPVCMRPSKDNILVARREGFNEVKASGRRTEEEKARGVQRSPDSLLFKWGQHPSQLALAPSPTLTTPTTPPLELAHGAAPDSVGVRAFGSHCPRGRETNSTADNSTSSAGSQGTKKKMRRTLDRGRKLLAAPGRLMKSCFCPSFT